ncbi:MAG: TonB-dependent receptor [Hyphomonadaceae bacterium]|nr:TonB-dependent receptor [Hyphomonadaceae bacterium]GIK50137.1 MAG: TonB-dependent receptor [Alphaproteobacteria bacterium]
MKKLSITCGLCLAAVAAPAFAQTAGEDGEIVVTAQRREERLQDVPIAVTAANAEVLAQARVLNLDNVATISPSIRAGAANISSSTASISIRGIGTVGNSRSFEGAVGVFIDGVYRTRAAAALQNFLDIDGLQVLRGPQGTLFGKNTTAGAVLLNSAAPSLDGFRGNYTLGYGNYDAIEARGALNLPLGDQAAVRIAALHTEREGFFTDPNTGEDLNGNETNAGKIQFLLDATPNLSIRLIGDYSDSEGNCCYATANYLDGPTQPLVDYLTLLNGLSLPSGNPEDFEQALNHPNDQTITDMGLTAIIDYDFLGGPMLRSITAYREFEVDQVEVDPDFSGADIFSLDESFASQFFSQELTLTGEWGSHNYVLGVFYSNENLDMTRDLYWGTQGQIYWDTVIGIPGALDATPGLWSNEVLSGSAESIAAFAHDELELSRAWSLIAGLRYSREEKEGAFANPYYSPIPNEAFRAIGLMPGPTYSASTSDEAISGTLGVQYRLSDDAMLYATYNHGFKAGGVNMDVNAAGVLVNNPDYGGTPLDPTYDAETTDAFELGGKFQYWNRRARTNFAIFYNDISDLQVAQFVGLQFTVLNAASAETYGAELESSFEVVDGVTLQLDATYLPHAEYGDDPTIGILAGGRFRYASRLAGNAAVIFERPVGNLTVNGRLQYQYTGPQFINTAGSEKGGSVGLVNANLGIGDPNGLWRLEAWVQNATDETYPTTVFATPLQTGDINAYLGAPRTYGIMLRGSF